MGSLDTEGRFIGILLDRNSGIPLHRQLRRHFTRLIANNELGDGEYLPSTRAIADTLGINRLTAEPPANTIEAEAAKAKGRKPDGGDDAKPAKGRKSQGVPRKRSSEA